MQYHLKPLDFENTREYIGFRLGSAGAEREMFIRDAFVSLYRISRGIPLRINNLCDRSLLINVIDLRK